MDNKDKTVNERCCPLRRVKRAINSSNTQGKLHDSGNPGASGTTPWRWVHQQAEERCGHVGWAWGCGWGQCTKERENLEDAMLPALNVDEEAISQEMQEASRS